MVDVEWLQRINYSSSTCMTRGEGADDLWLLWVPHSTVEGTMGPSQDRRGGEATNAKGNGEVHMHVGERERAAFGYLWLRGSNLDSREERWASDSIKDHHTPGGKRQEERGCMQ